MATWKVLCEVLYPKKDDKSVFPDLEFKKDELHFEENSVIKIRAFAEELAEKEFQKSSGYYFYAIDRIDKHTGKDYYTYIESKESYRPDELLVQFNKKQKKALKNIQSEIYHRVIIPEEREEGSLPRHFPEGLVRRKTEKSAYIQESNQGKIMPHSSFNSLKNFYERITPIEIRILNLEKEATVDNYYELRQYIAKLNLKKEASS